MPGLVALGLCGVGLLIVLGLVGIWVAVRYVFGYVWMQDRSWGWIAALLGSAVLISLLLLGIEPVLNHHR